MNSLDEKVWQAVEIGWTKPTEAPANWDHAKITTIEESKDIDKIPLTELVGNL